MPTQGFRQQTRLLEQTAPFQFQPPNGFSLGRSLGPQIQRPSALECLAAEVFVNGECLQRRLSGQACVYDQQCASLDGFQRLACVEGVCSSIQFLELQPPQPLPPPQILQNLPLNEMSPQGFPIQLPQPPPPPLQQPPPFPQQQPQVPPPLLPQPLPPSLLPPQQTQFPPSNILRVGDEYIPMEAGLLSQFLQLNFHCEEPHSWRGSENCVAVAPPTTAAHEVACGAGQLRINGVCYPIVGPGESCAFDMQCRSPVLERGMFCDNFVCRFADLRQWNPYPHELEFPVCRNPSAEVELSATIPKDCIYQRCSPGFHCEYNAVYKGGQYVCCGAHVNNPIYGQIKMYPGYTNLPLQCKAINSCTFVDFPFCVFSESYRHRVCCSRPQCL